MLDVEPWQGIRGPGLGRGHYYQEAEDEQHSRCLAGTIGSRTTRVTTTTHVDAVAAAATTTVSAAAGEASRDALTAPASAAAGAPAVQLSASSSSRPGSRCVATSGGDGGCGGSSARTCKQKRQREG